jgi:hypothetical protein
MMKTTTLVNKKALRAYILERARAIRYHEFTRVSANTLDQCEIAMKMYINRQLESLPSKGKTIDF